MNTTELTETTIETPIGPLRIAASDAGICRINFSPSERVLRDDLERRFGTVRFTEDPKRRVQLDRARKALERYFAGRGDDFDALELDMGGTDFQRRVWDSLRRIPTGETRSYAQIAASVRRPKAVRAVGAANGANPIPVVVPCHRVIGSDGTMVGYGGRIPRKEWLLRLEGAMPGGRNGELFPP